MEEWWNGLTLLEHVFYYCAVPATVILIIQTIASILGIGGNESDADFDGEFGGNFEGNFTGDFDSDFDGNVDIDFNSDMADFGSTAAENLDAVESASSLKFFSIRGIVAFFSLFGWVGIVLLEAELNTFLVFFIATVCGLIGMLLIAMMFYLISKMQNNGNINIKNAIDKEARVYLTIPANMTGTGKINITIQDRYSEISAMTKSRHPIATGSMVHVIGVIDSNTLLVEKQG